MVNGNLLVFYKGNAVKTRCQSEYSLLYAREFEIRAEHFGIQVVALLLKFVSIVSKVPGLGFVGRKGKDFCHFALSRRFISLNELCQQGIDRFGSLCHTALQGILSVSGVTQELRQLTAEVD